MFEQVLLCFEKYIIKNLRNCLIEYILTSSFLFFFFFSCLPVFLHSSQWVSVYLNGSGRGLHSTSQE